MLAPMQADLVRKLTPHFQGLAKVHKHMWRLHILILQGVKLYLQVSELGEGVQNFYNGTGLFFLFSLLPSSLQGETD